MKTKKKKKKKKEKREKKEHESHAKKQSDYIIAEGITTPSKEDVPPSLAATPAAYKLPVRSIQMSVFILLLSALKDRLSV